MCVFVQGLGAKRERGTGPSGPYMNHVHYIIERERGREGEREEQRDARAGMSVSVALL